MFIIHFLVFITFSSLSLISLSGLGSIMINKFNKNFLINIFFGFLVLGFIITFLHFFFRINLIIVIIIFLIGILFHFKFNKIGFKDLIKEYYPYFLIFLFLIPIYISQKYHEDFGYYHLPYVINLINEKIIFGLANTNDAFVHNSIWLNILSFFYINGNYDFITLPSFLLYFIFITFSLDQVIKQKKSKLSNFFLIICLYYLVLKFTRISEYGNDIPSLIFACLGVFYFLKFWEEDQIINDKKDNNKIIYFYYHLSFTSFAILIKFSVIPILILTTYLFLKNFNLLLKELFRFRFFLIIIFVILFFIQQFFYTGCFFFPSKITCINVFWYSDNFLRVGSQLELTNKSYSTVRDIFTPEEYLDDFNWFYYWLKRNYSELIENFLTMLMPTIMFLISLKKNKILEIKNFGLPRILIFFVISGFTFWLTFSPVYRFAILYFLLLVLLISYSFFKKRVFIKKNFLVIFIVFLFFNFSKNIIRISKETKIFFGIKKIENTYKKYNGNSQKFVSVYYPDYDNNNIRGNGWQGGLCWDIKFLCSYREIDIRSKNNFLFISKK